VIDAADTPYLEVDLDQVERNIARMQRYCDDHGLALRAHVKTHKIPEVARRQIAAGAAGIVCQKVGEAEVMAAAGLDDILIAFPVIGAAKTRRLANLAARARVTVIADSHAVLRGLSAALAAAEVEAQVLVDCDTGLHRTGVGTPEAAATLAVEAHALPGLRFAGLFTHPTPADAGLLHAARRAVEHAGLAVERVSGGGTPGAYATHLNRGITELRVGSYVYGDRRCIADGTLSAEECALRVRTTVVSRPRPGSATVDAGSKTLTSDPARGEHPGFGLVVEYPAARIVALSEEHGHLDVSRCESAPAVGETVTVIPNHACGVSNLHDSVHVTGAAAPEATWAIAARGAVR
jgi:D-serine deaminase-like pyridoxal phosphate-dependent protein